MRKTARVVRIASSRLSNADFLSQLFPPLAAHEVLWWHHNPEDHKTTSRWAGYKVAGADVVLDVPNENTFFSPTLFDNGNGQAARTAEFFSRLCVVVLDDVHPEDLVFFAPTYLIQTSPNKYQAGYKLAEPITDYSQAATLMAAITAGSGVKKDRSGNNVVRYVRLPVGTNTHYGATAHQSLVFLNEKTFTPDELEGWFGKEPEYIPSTSSWQGLAVEVKSLKKNAQGKYTDGGRKDLLRRWQMSMANSGKSIDEITERVLEFTEHFDDTWTEEDTDNLSKSCVAAVRKATRQNKDKAKEETPPDLTDDVIDDLLEVPEFPAAWPEHPWLMKPYFMRESVATINAPGGTGKSALVALLAASAASKKPLGPLTFDDHLKTVIVTYEDSTTEYKRRIASIDHIKQQYLKDNIRLVQASRLPGRSHFWVERIGSSVEQTGAASTLNELLTRFQPDLVFLDTLSQLNGADEDNATLAKIILSARLLAEDLNCCVVLIHHTGKEVARAGIIDQYSGRGGSAVSDNARSVLQLIHVDSAETAKRVWRGKLFEVREEQSVVALVHVKSNYAMAAEPIAMTRVACPRTGAYSLKYLDTSSLPDAPTSEEKKAAKKQTDMELALEWLRQHGEAPVNAVAKPLEFNIIKPADMKGSLKTTLDSAVEQGLVILVEVKRGGQKTKAYKIA